ncbi:hypothetical protein Tco_1119447 [Tanacetum coccineum]
MVGLSSSRIGFNYSGLGWIFGRYAELVSSKLGIFAVSGIGMSSTGYSECWPDCCLEEVKGVSLVSDFFQADNCGAGGCEEPEAPESCRFFLLRSESGGGGGS